MIPDLSWITPITWLVTLASVTMFSFYIYKVERVSWPIRFTMLGQFVCLAGKTIWDYTAFKLYNPQPMITALVMGTGGLILIISSVFVNKNTMEEME